MDRADLAVAAHDAMLVLVGLAGGRRVKELALDAREVLRVDVREEVIEEGHDLAWGVAKDPVLLVGEHERARGELVAPGSDLGDAL
ncbi:hypothetical protein D3C87_1969980 [compost metagenome]